MNTIRIAAAIVSKTGITLYLENGAEMNLPNDSWRTKAIMDRVTEPLALGEVVTINLDEFSVEKQIEDKTAGVIRFIKTTMAQLQEMLNDLEGGQKSTTSSSSDPVTPDTKEHLVAVVKNKDGSETMIPGVEKLDKQIEHAAYTGNTKGLKRFMQRIAEVIKERRHTVEELLHFMERGDLPIADDGSIIAYKVLTTNGKNGSKEGTFYDCHTKKVAQRLGSVVYMSPKLVDPSRRTECSTGLHIARRGYLRNFPGDVITLVRIAPEDVIAVPSGEPDKMRVASYHIVGVLPPEAHTILRANQPMTNNKEAAKLLADVIAGNHVGVLDVVRIGAAMGEDVQVKDSKTKKPAPKQGRNGEAKALDDSNKGISPKEIREKARQVLAEPKIPGETKAQRDARRKREKRAAEKAERLAKNNATLTAHHEQALGTDQAYPDKLEPLDIDRVIPGETKAERDARRKREKRAAARAAGGQA